MKTPPAAACDLEPAAVPAGSAAKKKVAKQEDDPRLRCAFVRRFYGILSQQFALTAAIAATALFVRPIQRFFAYGPTAAVILASPLIVCIVVVMFPILEEHREKHPRKNHVLLAVFTLCCSLNMAVSVFTTMDIAFLQAAILTVLGLTALFTIWATKRGYGYGYDLNDTFATLLTSLSAPLAYTMAVIPFTLNMVDIAICGFLATLLFSAAVAVDVANHHDDEDYINGGGSNNDADAPPAN